MTEHETRKNDITPMFSTTIIGRNSKRSTPVTIDPFYLELVEKRARRPLATAIDSE
jgi:hypothetical protein